MAPEKEKDIYSERWEKRKAEREEAERLKRKSKSNKG